jgi:HSP20 family protein
MAMGRRKKSPLDDEFEGIRRRMTNLLNTGAVTSSLTHEPWRRGRLFPLLKVIETEEAFYVMTEAPGMETKDLELSIVGETLCIKGERSIGPSYAGAMSYHGRERASGCFQRSVVLPARVDPEGVQANYNKGVLIVSIPKSRYTGARKIEVTTD